MEHLLPLPFGRPLAHVLCRECYQGRRDDAGLTRFLPFDYVRLNFSALALSIHAKGVPDG